ncbi:MAG: CopG family ribbon-helix-helix protein [Promethearchaeota archaeon]
MPIISISISESLKKFINKLVSSRKYENKSKIIRDALLRLMQTPEISNITDSSGETFSLENKNIIGNMIVVLPNDSNVLRKLNKIEYKYKDQIVSKNQHFSKNLQLFMVFEGSIEEFHKIVVEINSIKEVSNFRYLIDN